MGIEKKLGGHHVSIPFHHKRAFTFLSGDERVTLARHQRDGAAAHYHGCEVLTRFSF